MRRSRPLAALTGVGLLALAACGGGGSGDNPGADPTETFDEAQQTIDKDPERQGPAAEVEGAVEGGTITVYLNGDPGPDSMDPTDGWSVTGNSIQQALTHRALTQYARDPESGEMILVPDLATDLGTPNEDFTEWTFTIRDGLKWEDGSPITAEQVAFGISRSMDSETFPAGPGTEYSQTYFERAGEYEGPYSEPNEEWTGIEVSGSDVTIKMNRPFPDMDYWGTFMAMGPIPLGNASKPPAYGLKPLSNGPYKIESFEPTRELVLVRNDQWDPATDPSRHAYADRWVFKFNADTEQTDQVLLSGNEASQTAVADSIAASDYQDLRAELGDRLIQQSAQCTTYLSPDYTKITDLNVRKALAYAYPYTNSFLAAGQIPGVTRIPANTYMPPGMSGKDEEFQVDGEQITTNPERALELLGESGYGEDKPYPITMIYYEVDPLDVDVQDQVTKALNAAGFDVTAIPVQKDEYEIWLNPDDPLNKRLNVRAVAWCSDWPSGLTMLPPLLRTGASYNTSQFSEQAIDDRMNEIPTLPLEEQADAWGELDTQIIEEYFPMLPINFRNELLPFGERIGNATGDGAFGVPNYKDLFVIPE